MDSTGGVLLQVKLYADSASRMDRLIGKRYRSELAEPVALILRLDLYGLRAMAVRACRSKSGKCKSGPVQIRGGKAAKFRRVDEP